MIADSFSRTWQFLPNNEEPPTTPPAKEEDKPKPRLESFDFYKSQALVTKSPPLHAGPLNAVRTFQTANVNWRAALWFLVLGITVAAIAKLYSLHASEADPESVLPFYLFCIISAVNLTVFVTAPWPSKDSEHINDPEYLSQIGCVVPCHQSAAEIVTTVKSLLRFLKPEHIVVVDNGNSIKPLDNTKEVLFKLDPQVRYMWVPIGHKSNALWKGLNAMPPEVEYVMHIDDDTELPDDFVFDKAHWDNLRTSAVSYGICMKQEGPVQKCVDWEFKMISQLRLFQSYYSTVWFQHGIIGIWRRDALFETMQQHPFLPFGEDNWNGTLNLLMQRKMVQELRSHVTTYAPATIFPFSGSRQQGYGAANIWKQRAERWCVNAPRRFWLRLYLLFAYKGDDVLGSITFKLFSVHHLTEIIVTLLLPALFFRNLYYGRLLRVVQITGLMKLDIVLQSLMFYFIGLRKRPELRADLPTMLVYPFYRFFLGLCHVYGHYRCLFWYIPFEPMRCGIYTEGLMNADLLKRYHKINCDDEATTDLEDDSPSGESDGLI